MVRESWRKMQVPIIGIVGILLIFVVVVIKLGVTSDNYVKGVNVVGNAFTGEYCDVDFYDPVCCSDGVTYDNLCLCRVADATPEYQGICR